MENLRQEKKRNCTRAELCSAQKWWYKGCFVIYLVVYF